MHRWRTPGRGQGLTKQRDRWEHAWARPAEGFQWFRARAEPIITDTAARTDLPSGVAVDVGCGAGGVTQVLGERFPLALGLDLAFGAVVQARTRGTGHHTAFGVADACMLPLGTSTASLMVDRGCLHCLTVATASVYLEEVARVLVPGGRFVLIARTAVALPTIRWALRHPLGTGKELVQFVKRHPQGSMARMLSSFDSVVALLPDTLEVEHIERDRLRSDAGWHLRHLRLVARRV